MHESDAFERQIAGEMMRRAGPIRSVDDAAIWAAVVATKAPNRSIGGFLGVIRFAAAGVIVAAFGSFLLAVALTQPRDQDNRPVVGGASPSPAASTVVPSPAVTVAPSPTTVASPSPSVSPALPRATATKFARPFEYSIPSALASSTTYEDSEVFALAIADEYQRETSPRLFGGVQADAAENGIGSARGILIADVTDAAVSTCSLENPRQAYKNVGRGPAAFLDSLEEPGGLRLEDRVATTFGGQPAIAASTVFSRCARTEMIIGTRPIWEAYALLEIPSRIIVADVGESTVMAQIWAGTPIDLEEWLPTAQGFIDSMDFDEDGDVVPSSQAPAPPE